MSAFAIAFQVPNLLRSLVADAALQAAFVPVFAELLEQWRKREAYGLASALFGLILAVLGGIDAAPRRDPDALLVLVERPAHQTHPALDGAPWRSRWACSTSTC